MISNLLRRFIFPASLLSPGLAWHSAQAQGPWVAQPALYSPAPYNTSFVSLELPGPTTIWGWSVETGAAGAQDDRLVFSSDEGQSWQIQQVASKVRTGLSTFSGTQVQDACTTNGEQIWLLTKEVNTGAKTLQRTTSGLSNFTLLPTPPSDAFHIRFFDANTGIIVGKPAAAATTWPLYRTTDAGVNWQAATSAIPHLPNDLPGKLVRVGNAFWMTTTKGQLLHTADAGMTWRITALPVGTTAPAAVAFQDAANGLLLASSGSLARTSDGGLTWSPVLLSGPVRTEGLTAVPGSTSTYISFDGLCQGSSCPIKGSALSVDNGATWRELENTIYHTVMVASSPSRAWTGSYFTANLYRTSTLVLKNTTAYALETALAFPNPTTGQLRMKAASWPRSITLFDATGRPCKSLNLPAQATTIDVSECPSGLYILRCTSQGLTQTQRVALLAK